MKPSIFNDVIGPVMRGPSSSHTAASHRIGAVIRQLCRDEISRVSVEFHRGGSLATTYEGQGASMGLISGLAGLSILDPEIRNYKELPARHNFEIEFIITDYEASHPNTYRISVENSRKEIFTFTALSTGGGSIEFISINGFQVSLRGDKFVTLICFNPISPLKTEELKHKFVNNFKTVPEISTQGNDNHLFIILSEKRIKSDLTDLIKEFPEIKWIRQTDPVLPVLPRSEQTIPYNSIEEMLISSEQENRDLARMAIKYECAFADIDEKKVFSLMSEISRHIRFSIDEGLKGQQFSDRILGHQSHLIQKAEKDGKIIPSPLNTIISYVTAIMESKSSMEIIVAAPTAGSCGTVGGAIFAAAEHYPCKPEAIVNAFLAAGLIGVFIADKYTFAAEQGGCQVECGAASAMAAAGIVQLMGGNARQAVNAASMALQNCLGMICDPVADRVEVPCLGKNILAATNALNSANMAIAGFDAVVPLDEVIDALKSVGDALPRSLCCTGLGGLSQTPTSLKLLDKLNRS